MLAYKCELLVDELEDLIADYTHEYSTISDVRLVGLEGQERDANMKYLGVILYLYSGTTNPAVCHSYVHV